MLAASSVPDSVGGPAADERQAPYGLAIGVNLVGLGAGAGGSINPVVAALLHNTSSIAVVGNSARLVNHTAPARRTRPRPVRGALYAAPLEDRRVI
ncbi:hypothetical protein [Streptomyces spiramyceticus]|uniref:hypothetical protein n=1 Tax=Streptomyces spiramyceticus TaxID=299717 RepID=UPI00237B35B6|nr:hypothetical protein [Streptomyces spiramyceticus]